MSLTPTGHPTRDQIAATLAPMIRDTPLAPAAQAAGHDRAFAIRSLTKALLDCWNGARGRQEKVPFALTPRLYLQLIEQSGLRCAITDMPFSAVRLSGARKRLFAPSLDRIDPKRGYVAGNVRFTSVWANLARNDAEDDGIMAIMGLSIARRAGARLTAVQTAQIDDIIVCNAPWSVDPACGSGGLFQLHQLPEPAPKTQVLLFAPPRARKRAA
ncbi:hypothetical protein [Oceanibaculum pacificum]|uniref:Uncharacterized protein n=1 Tax=Oceanibaculum pacificum TaxID=580166 RepID=A0A154WFZ7_9PROT|nr:hypothetical protein [Oceanibaculum pacificum]KZD12416.1 hypothetical protein AUP43_16415 [Oceanibaculum pacificum]